jgi:hypothetical protein
MQNITAAVNKVVGEEVEALFNMFKEEIQQAYLKKEGALTIPISVKFVPQENSDELEVEAAINWSPNKIKESVSRIVNETQGELFKKEGK